MGTVYNKARQVIVWLGPESENSSVAMKTLQWVGQAVKFAQSDDTLWKSEQLRRLEQDPKALAVKKRAFMQFVIYYVDNGLQDCGHTKKTNWQTAQGQG